MSEKDSKYYEFRDGDRKVGFNVVFNKTRVAHKIYGFGTIIGEEGSHLVIMLDRAKKGVSNRLGGAEDQGGKIYKAEPPLVYNMWKAFELRGTAEADNAPMPEDFEEVGPNGEQIISMGGEFDTDSEEINFLQDELDKAANQIIQLEKEKTALKERLMNVSGMLKSLAQMALRGGDG
jgi:hypothetical protein